MAKKSAPAKPPAGMAERRHRHHPFPKHLVRELERLLLEGARLMSTAADLKAATDALTSQVSTTNAQIADLKAQIAAHQPPLLSQEELDAAVSTVQNQTDALRSSGT